jgi:hypothetical protein
LAASDEECITGTRAGSESFKGFLPTHSDKALFALLVRRASDKVRITGRPMTNMFDMNTMNEMTLRCAESKAWPARMACCSKKEVIMSMRPMNRVKTLTRSAHACGKRFQILNNAVLKYPLAKGNGNSLIIQCFAQFAAIKEQLAAISTWAALSIA